MPTIGRNVPPWPPLETFPVNGYASNATFYITIFAASCAGLAALSCWAADDAAKKRDTFLAKCIEFQTVDRCESLYRYGREDLMEQRR